jgi:hypothetical protein
MLILLLGCGAASFGQERDLHLTIDIINRQACALNANLDALQLTLQLRYTNVGTQKLILYKGNRLFYQVFISYNAKAAATRNFEVHTTHARYFDEQPEKIKETTPGSVFTVLSPRASYQTRQIVSVTVAREAINEMSNTVNVGEHILFLIASTWFESKKLAEELRERWRGRGFLWTDSLASNAINFSVDRARAAVICETNIPHQ